GISYSAKLKSGTNVERNLEVSSWGTGNKKDFTQPDWADDLYGVDGTYDLDISKIEGFTISAAENYGKTVNIKITRFIVEGLYDDK
ncbi:MAG: hypothetical protein LBH98_05940, partial [Chitinispirillales bacterium]|nr:hypothetical protein [Chitinispirillales bacterium]